KSHACGRGWQACCRCQPGGAGLTAGSPCRCQTRVACLTPGVPATEVAETMAARGYGVWAHDSWRASCRCQTRGACLTPGLGGLARQDACEDGGVDVAAGDDADAPVSATAACGE